MRTFTILAMFTVLSVIPIFAQQQQFSDEVARELVPLRNSVQALKDTASAGIIGNEQAQAGIARYMRLASRVANRTVTQEELVNVKADQPVQLSAAQKFVGWLDFVKIMWIAAILVGVVSIMVLFGEFVIVIAKIFILIPATFYEVILYMASFGLIFAGDQFRPDVASYVALTGCVLFAGAVGFSCRRFRGDNPTLPFAIVTFVWGGTAVLYSSSMIGFFAVIALMGTLGFSAAMYPGVVCLGFKDEDAVGKATVAAFSVLVFFAGARIFGKYLPTLGIFEQGALFMGSFVGYLGLLIASSRWYRRRYPYVFFQMITISAGILALFIGSVYQIPELSRIGGTFFALYLLEKFIEIPVESRVGYAFLGLTGSSAVYWFCITVMSNPERFRQYLLF